ncbi:MAG: sel1 repeat family protein [Akkermansia sp.]|nr:sel1 repeat family protein [Akkermansia sp.]
MAKKRNTIEDYLNELYRRGMAGDEEAQLEFIQVIVMETAAPLEGVPLEWLNALVKKGNTQARRCYFAWAMNGDAADCDWQRLVQWAEELLDESPGDAHCMLGMIYEPGLPGLEDNKLAEEHYRKAIEAGNEGCCFYLARVLLGREENEELPYAEARELLERAERVNPSAAVYDLLGMVCQELGDDAAAVKCFQKLHRLAPSDSECCLELAQAYALGAGVRQDDEIALRYFQKAANLGDSYGTFMVGLHYYEGLGTRRNFKRAVDYFNRALEMGDTRALYHLGICCSRGEGVRQDSAAAEEYWQRGAALNDALCCVALAMHSVDAGELQHAEELLAQAREHMVTGDEELERQMEIVELCISTARNASEAESV